MRPVPASISTSWQNGTFIGDRRPIARVTVAHPTMKLRNYTLLSSFTEILGKIDSKHLDPTITFDVSHGQKVKQCYADYMFTHVGKPMELPNVKNVSWTRSIDSDVADCTVEVWNTKPLPIGDTPRDGELDLPGYYTYSRGASKFSSRWQHTRNEWFGMLVPDNILRTYEGYGWDENLPPEKDPHLVQTGTWLIDSVAMNATGTMTLKCRDVGRILMDQMFFAPVVPPDWIGRGFENWTGINETIPNTTKLKVKATSSSNIPWVGPNGSVHGHKLAYAFDGDPNTYWLSIGNVSPTRRFAYEWVQCSVGNQSVTDVKISTKKSGYTAYVSVMVGGVWQGSQSINYHEDDIGKNDADVPYVISQAITSEKLTTIKLPKAYKKVQAVRVTLGNLQNFHIPTYLYRGGFKDVQVHNSAAGNTTRAGKKGPPGSNPGRYSDYTDLVKLFCAWGGLFWPKGGYRRISDTAGTHEAQEPTKYDWKVLGHGVKGRVFGEFQQTYTNGVAALTPDQFDQKSLMECIGVVRDIVGFIFHIDEIGGAIWRFPNIQNRGSWQSSITGPGKYVHDFAHPIDENSVLMTLDCTIDSSNVREAFYVGDGNGKIGAFAPGFNPNPTGLRRMAGWTDANFADGIDGHGKDAALAAQITADLISLRTLFTYRTDRLRIPANPAIQIDDQVRISERTTAEGYLHYVKGISSNLDNSSGQWTYDLDTHWLGFDPKSRWLFKPTQFDPVTVATLDGYGLAVVEAESRAPQGI